MSKDYEEFMSSQQKKEKVTDIKITEIYNMLVSITSC